MPSFRMMKLNCGWDLAVCLCVCVACHANDKVYEHRKPIWAINKRGVVAGFFSLLRSLAKRLIGGFANFHLGVYTLNLRCSADFFCGCAPFLQTFNWNWMQITVK
jgi:hypothetical protein